jgi:hypothetical protein
LDAEIQAVIDRKAHGIDNYANGMDMNGDEEKVGHIHSGANVPATNEKETAMLSSLVRGG